jgi:diadenosine tetraphosphatase ApaH/serine/threonine PP2A family protein phosphatase
VSRRVAVLSDVHSNLAALEAVLATLGSVDGIWVLGDIVGYGPQPQAVVDRLRDVGAIGVRGNHDDAAGGGESIEFFNPDGCRAMEWTRARIDERTRLYLASLPESIVPAGAEFTLAHGSPSDPIWEYLDSPAAAGRNLSAFETRYCLVGHTHVPRVFREARERTAPPDGRTARVEPVRIGLDGRFKLDDRRSIFNPGSVGQPRDGDPRASYMLIDTDAGLVTWHRVEYDVSATQEAIMAAGLPSNLARRLSVGM